MEAIINTFMNTSRYSCEWVSEWMNEWMREWVKERVTNYAWSTTIIRWNISNFISATHTCMRLFSNTPRGHPTHSPQRMRPRKMQKSYHFFSIIFPLSSLDLGITDRLIHSLTQSLKHQEMTGIDQNVCDYCNKIQGSRQLVGDAIDAVNTHDSWLAMPLMPLTGFTTAGWRRDWCR